MRCVDAHIHLFPERLAWAVRERLNVDGRLTSSPLVAGVAQGLLDGGFVSGWVLPYAHRAGVAESINEWSAKDVAVVPCLVAGATFHPADDDLPRLVERALVELGLRVVKLHCAVGQFSPTDSRLIPLWETASRLRIPVVVHAGQASPGDTAAAEVDELEPVLTRFSELSVVLAHSGHPATAKTVELMGRHPHLYADLTPVWDRPVALGAQELLAFPARFLFGSDAPNNPVPATEQRSRLEKVPLPANVLEQILGGTAEALVPLS